MVFRAVAVIAPTTHICRQWAADAARYLFATRDPDDAVARLHEAGMMDLSARQTLLREWLTGQVLPLFSLEEGTAVFTEDEAVSREVFGGAPSKSS